jgi:UDP-N-acetylmuramate dehydrogenase
VSPMNDTLYSKLYAKLYTLLGERLLVNEALSKHTSFKIGGPCAAMALPSDADTLVHVVELVREYAIPYFLMGNGTNLLCPDEGYAGVVIKTTGINSVCVDGNEIIAECGASLAKTAVAALDASLAGLEFAHGIPGSVGGGVVMNAGAYGGEIAGVAVRTKYLTAGGQIKEVTGEAHGFGYRKSIFSSGTDIVLQSAFRLKKGDAVCIKGKMAEISAKRRSTQPLDLPSAGSVFKRPAGLYAGKLIEDCGLKGYKIGGAQVSEKHSGFIVNTGGATAHDVLELISYIKERVYGRFGVELECEIKVIS